MTPLSEKTFGKRYKMAAWAEWISRETYPPKKIPPLLAAAPEENRHFCLLIELWGLLTLSSNGCVFHPGEILTVESANNRFKNTEVQILTRRLIWAASKRSMAVTRWTDWS